MSDAIIDRYYELAEDCAEAEHMVADLSPGHPADEVALLETAARVANDRLTEFESANAFYLSQKGVL